MMERATNAARSNLWPTFYLGDETFALSADDVQEVMMAQPLTPVPLASDYIVGLLNLRGQIMPAIDLRRRLDFPPRPADEPSIIMVLKTHDSLVSVIVDRVGDVLEIDNDGWEPAPDTLAAPHRNFVFGLFPAQNDVVLGLRVEALSGDDELSPGSP